MGDEELVLSEKKEDAGEKVVLSKDQYTGLLERLDELETAASSQASRRKAEDIDALAQEGVTKSTPQEPQQQGPVKPLDEMSNSELVNLIMNEVGTGGRELMTKVQTLEVLREIDKCEIKYPDFWDHEQEVHKLAVANPTLSIEQCYKLAKEAKGPVEKKDPKGEPQERLKTRTEKLLNLPSLGERPSIAPGATKVGGITSLKDAAEAAWAEVIAGKK